jgi:CBS domain-containing protein
MNVSEVMTRRVISILPEASISDAVKLMLKNHISGLPVIDDKGKLVGILTEGDLLRRPEIGTERGRSRWLDALFGPGAAADAYVHSHSRKVKDLMTRDPVTVKESAPLHEVVHLLERGNIKRLPIVRAGKVVGIISRANLIRALAGLHRVGRASERTDSAIRNRILAEMGKQDWAYSAFVDVTVRKGVVDLWGTITDLEQREALRVLAENTPGVKKIEDHLRWSSEPVSVS